MNRNKNASFHITYTPPDQCHESWNNGMWALYAINGDEIAQRVKFDSAGKVTRRDSWPGYVGGYHSLADLMQAIENQE
jgi:hypothetical protein